VLSRARPIRVAFLVENEERYHPVLDSIFEYCYSNWGGRFSLIVPCTSGVPDGAYSAWLDNFDPDIIYSYLPGHDEDQITRFHERNYPCAFYHHGSVDDTPSFRPEISTPPLSTATVVPLAALRRHNATPKPFHIVASLSRESDDPFLRSMGVASVRLRNAFRGALAHQVRPLWLRPPELENSFRGRIQDGEAVAATRADLLRLLVEHPDATTEARLSAMAARRANYESSRWGGAFNLVVGKTVSDRIAFWNIRLQMPAFRDGDSVDMNVAAEALDDAVFVEALRTYLQKRTHIAPSHGGNYPRVAVRSLSIGKDELEKLAARLQGEQRWCAFTADPILSHQDCVPARAVLERAAIVESGTNFASRPAWRETYVTTSSFRAPESEPSHLRHAPSALSSPASGLWAVDLDIERSVDHSPFVNVQHRWRLPRALRVTRAFLDWYQLGDTISRPIAPRVTATGLLTVFAASGTTPPLIKIPDDHSAIKLGLESGRDWEVQGPVASVPPEQLCFRAERSSAGRHFWGVYQLFADMNVARSFLLSKFWRRQLEAFGATDQRTDVRRAALEQTLQARFRGRLVDPMKEDQLGRLADIVLQYADEQRLTVPTLSWHTLSADFSAVVQDYVARNPRNVDLDWSEEAETASYFEGLKNYVQQMCRLGVLHQGYEYKCRKCLHRSWISIDSLSKSVACDVCRSAEPAPIDRPWEFRLNGFLREALQRHGIAPLFWALSRFQERSQQSFWFDAPLDIYESADSFRLRRKTTDIDLTIVDNGKVFMCEAKQSARQVTNPEKLASTFLRLRPDVAVLAVMQEETSSLRSKFERFSAVFNGTSTEPRLICLETDDISDAPYF